MSHADQLKINRSISWDSKYGSGDLYGSVAIEQLIDRPLRPQEWFVIVHNNLLPLIGVRIQRQ
jgi:hypothetical protein